MSRERQSVTRALWGNPRTSAVLASTAAPVAALGQRPASTGAVRRIAVAPPSGRCAAVWAHVRLARAETLLAFVGTFVGAGLVGFEGPSALVVAVAASNMLLSSASMMFNDWHDVEEDRINRPDRPIPSGQVPRDRALVMSATLYVVALVVAVIAGLPFGLGAAAVIGLSIIYTWRLKAIPVLGHGVTALLSGYPLLCWMSVARFEDSVYLAFTAGYVVAGIGKEVVRTAADAPGDAAAGIRTVATLRGGRSANRIGAGVVAVALMVGWLPILLGDAGIAFAVALTLGTIAALMFGVPRLSGPPRESSRQLIFLARAIMVLLVLAVTVDLVRAGWSSRASRAGFVLLGRRVDTLLEPGVKIGPYDMMAVAIDTAATFDFEPPNRLFESHLRQPPSYDVAPDGRFVMITSAADPPISVILDWTELLRPLGAPN